MENRLRIIGIALLIIFGFSLLLRLTGLTNNFWFTFGMLVLIGGLFWGQSEVRASHPKFALALTGFGVTLTVALLISIVSAILLADRPFTAQALREAREDSDLRLGELLKPIGYLGRLHYRNQCDNIAREAEKELGTRLNKIKESSLPPSIKLKDINEILPKLRGIEEVRNRCAQATIEARPLLIYKKLALPKVSFGAPGWILFLVGTLWLALIVAVGTKKPYISQLAFLGFGLIVLYFVVSFFTNIDADKMRTFLKELNRGMQTGDVSIGRTLLWFVAFPLAELSIVIVRWKEKKPFVLMVAWTFLVFWMFDWAWWQTGILPQLLEHIGRVTNQALQGGKKI